jgi:hypothetical protein
MLFSDLLRFRQEARESSVPEDIIRQLGIPMDEDVLEQFIIDHGTNEEFQQQFGNLDIHQIEWRLVPTAASDILSASIFEPFKDMVSSAADLTRVIPREGWDSVDLAPEAVEHWRDHGTWMRAPVTLRGNLVGRPEPLHLVEGHTRVGALRGLVESRVVATDSPHEIWIGEPSTERLDDGPWRDVLRREHVSFLDWLMRQIDTENDLSTVADRLISSRQISSTRRVHGDDLQAVLAFAQGDERLRPLQGTIRESEALWREFITP